MKQAVAACLALAALLPATNALAAPTFGYQVIAEYPHDPDAVTEGLLYDGGYLYESTGLNAQSSLRRIDVDTGEILQIHNLQPRYFAEGITLWGDTLIQLTYVSRKAFVYDRDTFALLGELPYTGQGWGLTNDGARLLMSDGSSWLEYRDPVTFDSLGGVEVTEDGAPVDEINELEYVNGLVFANVWPGNAVLMIEPDSGEVVGRLDLTALQPPSNRRINTSVANGIAYDAVGDRLFVTGKYWPKVYEIALVP